MTVRRVINTTNNGIGENNMTSDSPLLLVEESSSDDPTTTSNEGLNGNAHHDSNRSSTSNTSHSPSNGTIRNTIRKFLTLLATPILDDQGSFQSVLIGLLTLFVIGGSIGLVMPKNSNLPHVWYQYISSTIGYIYFLCWSVSFYPQVISNYQRQSTIGLSPDFVGLNVLGFSCYSVYTVLFYGNSTIQELYKERYGETSEITVQSNDVAFALHALLLSSITFFQIGYYGGGIQAQKPTSTIILIITICILCLTCIIYPLLILTKISSSSSSSSTIFNWLDYLYFLSYIKVLISLIKYIPQVLLNYRRKSTIGWSIWNIILDFTGGTLSDMQLVFDCTDLNDFSGITGNIAKFALGSVSILFDIIFLLQHYVFYSNNNVITVNDNHDTTTTTTTTVVNGPTRELTPDPELPLEAEPLL